MTPSAPPSRAPQLTAAQLAQAQQAVQALAATLERASRTLARCPGANLSASADAPTAAEVLTAFEWVIDTVAGALHPAYDVALTLDPNFRPRVRWTPAPSRTATP